MANWFVRINHRKGKAGELFSEQAERKLYYDLDTKKTYWLKLKKTIQNTFLRKSLNVLLKANYFMSIFMN